ncbi:MAG: HU family DNA-binding protein [Deltaproteobacteria bacterium]|nr:HU family DNA-binding protein [Deltaproteobacteria bacterium]
MTKAELVSKVADKADGVSKKTVEDLIDATFDAIAATIKKEKRFAVPGFGTFTVRNRAARKGRNPQTGQVINIKASKTVGFKPAPGLKGKL